MTKYKCSRCTKIHEQRWRAEDCCKNYHTNETYPAIEISNYSSYDSSSSSYSSSNYSDGGGSFDGGGSSGSY